MLDCRRVSGGAPQIKKVTSDRQDSSARGRITPVPVEKASSSPVNVRPEKQNNYSNLHDESYQTKLARVSSDIKAGVIDRLTLKIGRERYQVGDFRTKQMQVDLMKSALLEKVGKQYRVAA